MSISIPLLDFKADVHRKNSSESSEEISVQPAVHIVAYHPKVPDTDKKHRMSELRSRRQHGNIDSFPFAVKEDMRFGRSNFYQVTSDQAPQDDVLDEHRPSLQSVELDQSISNLVQTPRRHSIFTNGSLNLIPSNAEVDIKPTGKTFMYFLSEGCTVDLKVYTGQCSNKYHIAMFHVV